jgi:transposase-like protein
MNRIWCIKCHSQHLKKNGTYKHYQKYACKNCGGQFSERSFSFFCRSRYPEEVITNAVLYTPFVSTRNSAFLVKETLQFSPSHVSVYHWMKKFAFLLKGMSSHINFSNIWHVDEKFVKVKGCKDFAYLWVVLDDHNTMVAVHVSPKRDIAGARTVLALAKERAQKPPDILVTDGLPSYIRACRKVFGRGTKHVQAHFEQAKFMHKGRYYMLSNNRIESLNSKINLWYKKFRGFKRLDMANLWCTMWMHFYNFMRPRVIPHEIVSIHQVLR